MSSHYIYVKCGACSRSNALYTGDEVLDDFDCEDWEGETIEVFMCTSCKEAVANDVDITPPKSAQSTHKETEVEK